ncbi:UNVERIFIED_CONTAM: hypothetical protein Scaly_2221400 [Sesamum calycinum]|uniref:Uncharacterized protein n=1 Tax=Sesamum calycinum TaxID=2727403 RepID=A0AAW2MA33_9LAMI
MTNAITIESGHVDGNKDSYNAMYGDNITSNEDTLFKKDNSSDDDDCICTITFTDEDLPLGFKPHNRPLFVAGYVREQKVNRILIDGGSAVNILPLQILKELGIPIDEDAIDMEDMVSSALFHVIDAKTSYNMLLVKKVLDDNKPFTEAESHFASSKYYIEDAKKENEINLKQSSKPPLKGFVPSIQEEEGGHEALVIDKKGFDPKAFKLFIKVGYNPKEKLSLRKLRLEANGKKLHGLNAIQIMLKEKGHAIHDSRVGLDFTPLNPICIAIKRVNNNYVFEGFSSTEDHKREESFRESVFNRLGPHKKALHRIVNRQSIFDRLDPCKRVRYQKKYAFKVTVRPKKNIKSSHIQKLRSLIASRMRRQTTLAISCGRVLKAKAENMIFIRVQSDDDDDKENVASSNYICTCAEDDIVQTYHITLIEDSEIEEEDVEDAPVELEEGIKATMDELKEVNLGEVNKLIEVGFIREVKYPMWISSIVPVRKKNGQIRVCVDFRDLNNACPKDDFPLPIAELMIDATTAMKLYPSWMDHLDTTKYVWHQ